MNAVVVTGDRYALPQDWESVIGDALVSRRLDLVIVGDSSGVDDIARRICADYVINYVMVLAMWDNHGKSAGPRRNRDMLSILAILQNHGYEIEVLAFHDDIWNSKGTKNCVESAYGMGIPYTVYTSAEVRVE